MPMTQALDLLKKDHKKVLNIIEQLLETTARATVKRKELLNELKNELKLHEKIEESLFYPKLKTNAETKPLIIEAYEEHHLVDIILDELDKTNFNDESFKAKIMVLKENLSHHIHEEENEIFPKAKQKLGDTKLEQMGKDIEKMKEETA
jgi:hemerythrin superfamily protein